MSKSKFTDKDNPAKDIHELLCYLKDEEHGTPYIYRGQVREYDAPLVPSMYRGCISYSDRVISRDDAPFRHAMKKIGNKYYGDYVVNFQNSLNGRFANILAEPQDAIQNIYQKALRSPMLLFKQQTKRALYNAFSTRLDLIRSVLSREEWQLFDVYKDKWMPSINNYDRRIIRMFGFFKPLGFLLGTAMAQQYGFSSEGLDATKSIDVACFFATHGSGDYYNKIVEEGTGIIYRFPYEQGFTAREGVFQYDFYSPHSLIDVDDIFEHLSYDVADINDFYRAFSTFYSKRMMEQDADTSLLKLPTNSYQNSRIFRQKAVILLPDEIREEDESSELSIIGTKLPRYQYIEDLSSRDGVEKFYFRHSRNTELALNREHLWPREDPVLYLVVWIITSICQRTFSKDQHFITYRLDLIDGGYDPGEFLTMCQNMALEHLTTIVKDNTVYLVP